MNLKSALAIALLAALLTGCEESKPQPSQPASSGSPKYDVLFVGKWTASTNGSPYVFKSDGTVLTGQDAKVNKWVSLKPDGSVLQITYSSGWADTFTFVSETKWSVTGNKPGGKTVTFELIVAN